MNYFKKEPKIYKGIKLFLGLSMFSLMLLLSSCGDDDEVVLTDSIVDVAGDSDNLNNLVAALGRFPDLVNTLSDDGGTFTVFAPNDDAFAALLQATGQSSLLDLPDNVLRRVLEYHVVSGSELLSTSLTDGATAATVLGDNITVGVDGSSVTINGANVIQADVPATNGIVHVIDAVLVPALEVSILNTVVAPAYFNNNFEILSQAVQDAGLLNTLIDPQEEFTVFAPTDDAFTAAGITSLGDVSTERLTQILQYHVLDGEVTEAQLPATGSAVPTLRGSFYLSINSTGVFINGNSQVTDTDIQADNGVVHVINRTLIPAEDNIVDIAIAASQATEGAEFGQLVAALTRVSTNGGTNLVEFLSSAPAETTGDAPFTVFAPTDAAFQNLYTALQVQGVDDIDVATLEAVLTYHVVADAWIFSSDLPNLTSSTVTALGGDFDLDVSTLVITYNDSVLGLTMDDTSNIVASGVNILGTNGVIHTIDKVLLP